MRPIVHLILGIVLAIILFVIFPEVGLLEAGVVVIFSVLIDIDHYVYYVFRKKEISPIKAYKWYTTNIKKFRRLTKKQIQKISFGFHFLHGIEILIILYILFFFVSPIFLYMLIGVFFHLGLDLIDEITKCRRLEKISIIYGLIKHKKSRFVDDLDLPEPEITQELKASF